MALADHNITDKIDITDVTCPITFVKAKVAIEELEEGEILQIHLNHGEPLENVPRSLGEEGHEVLEKIDNGDGTWELIVRRGAD
ncbi:MAG: sulfurtransferase TusA family protein [Lachnospiraceae bacterium]|nr:sulfurtransferase TusA family protein [Lachnospiraceae bacterium]